MPQFYRSQNLRSVPGNTKRQRTPAMLPATRWGVLVLLLVWVLSAAYVGLNLNHGWDPHDEGTLGQSAERVLHGEMPHRDFDDPYTGGLAYIDALIFKLLDVNLFWLRLFLFVCFLAWVPAIYALAREFLLPWPAGAVTLVAVAWSVPNYTAAMPSWFNLFLATFGTLALAKYIRKPAILWLVLAGLCGGCSFLIKSVALYYIVGALLFFVYREQSLSRKQIAPPTRTLVYFTFLILCLSIFVAALIKLVFVIGETAEYLHFVFPGLTVALLLAARERTPASVSNWSRFKALFQTAGPFLLASAVPILLFFVFYWYRGALAALSNGLFVAPFRRVFYSQRGPAGLIFEYPAILAILLIVETAKLRGRSRRILSVFLIMLAALVLLTSRSQDLSYIIALESAWGMIPVLAVCCLFALFVKHHSSTKEASENDQLLVLLFAMTVLFSLIQFPYAQIIYFCYGAPFVALLAAFLISRLSRPPRMMLSAAIAFYVMFAVFVIRPHYIGSRYHLDYDSVALDLPRAGMLHVSRAEAVEFRELIPFVKNLAGQNPIFAGPDSPEVYFLAGIKNPTPLLYDSLAEPRNYERDTIALLDRPNFLKVAVINDSVSSAVYQTQLLRSLVVTRFPNSRKIGSFTVYWRS